MNIISRFIYAALVVFSTVACHTSEIDNPNKDNPDKPQISDNIQLTASIKLTRVEYSINGEKLEQKWTVGDAIYGFYGGDIANKIVFSVESVDEDTGVASLKPESGWSGFLSAFKADNSLPVGLVYTGCTTSEIPSAFQSYGTIEVDMTSQGTDRIPACMHANNFSSRTVDDVTYVTFLFENDCSIIEVFSFSGVAEDYDTYLVGDSAGLDSIEVDGLIEGCKYSLDNDGKLQFEAIDKTEGADVPTTVTLGGSWSVTKYGDITYGDNIKPVYIAAVPFENKDFTVTAKLIRGINNISVPFDNKTFVGGNSYYIMASPVVARTADGVYFKTVTEAFEHADNLYNAENSIYHSAEKNIVTLVRDCGLAGVEPEDGEYKPLVGTSEPIEIDGYDVTLDLNGHTLTLENECFQVNYFEDEDERPENPNIFTIKDSEGDGEIISLGDYMIMNSGTVNIECGKFTSTDSDGMVLNGDTGVLTINGGTLQSSDCPVVENHGILNVEGGEISSEGTFPIDSEGEANISGGIIHCDDSEAISISGELNITGGTIWSDQAWAIMAYSSIIDISGGCEIRSNTSLAISMSETEFTMDNGTVSGKAGGIQLTDGSTGKIIGGTIESKGDEEDDDGYALYIDNSTCIISGGTIKNESTKKPAIYCFTGVDKKDDFNTDSPNLIIQWNNGSSASDVSRKVDPLIVSNADPTENDRSYGPISIKKSTTGDNNYAVVMVAGGYLFSKDDACYSIESIEGVRNLLWIPDDCYFYTNEASDPNNNKPHYFDFGLSENNLVEVPFETVSIDYNSYHFDYKIIPGEGSDVDTNITGGSLGSYDKEDL